MRKGMKKGKFFASMLLSVAFILVLSICHLYENEPCKVFAKEKITDHKQISANKNIEEYRENSKYYEDIEKEFHYSFSDEAEFGFSRNWGVLPQSYSSSSYVDWDFERVKNYITPVKDQKPYGTCWSYSTIAAAESSYIINEGITDVESVDFNEYHLIHFTYDTPSDPLKLFGGDQTNLNPSNSFLDAGGNNKITACVLANWIGASDTKEFSAEDVELEQSDAFAFKDIAHLENAYFIAMPDMSSNNYQTDMDVVKNMLMTYGAATVTYYSNGNGGEEFEGYYYCPTEYMTNHAVTIVGWDDTIPGDSFRTKAPGDGAWLVKNSWSDYGEFGGYFWLSYYDESLSNEAYIYDMVSADNYDNNYQYDGANGTSYEGYQNKVVFANAFQADSLETLEAVGFYTHDVNMDYEIRIYKDLKENEAPQYGDLVLTQTGKEVYAGFHTIELQSSISLKENERYAVVVSLSKPNTTCFATLDKTVDHGWVSFTSYAKAGESYLGYSINSLQDLNPKNTEHTKGSNVRLKAYTNEVVGESSDDEVDTSINGLHQVEGVWYYFQNGKVDQNFTGLTNSPYGWWYVENGVITFHYNNLVYYNGSWWYVQNSNITFQYDGVVDYNGSTWYIEDSRVDFSKNGLHQRGSWYYFKGGAVDKTFTGLTNSPYGWWYVENGVLEFDYTNLVYYNGSWWYVQNSNITFQYDGVVDYNGSTWYIEDSRVDFSKNGLHQRGSWYYFKGGAVDKTFTGLTNSPYGWWYVENGVLEFDYTNLVYYNGSWWYVQNSNITFQYDGVVDYNGSTWYIEDSRVDFSKNGLLQRGNWYYFKGGAVDRTFTGLTNSPYGWWYIEKGVLEFDYNNLVYYNGSWWYVQNSNITFQYDGVVKYNGSWWYVRDSRVDFAYNGTYQFNGKSYKIKNGQATIVR